MGKLMEGYRLEIEREHMEFRVCTGERMEYAALGLVQEFLADIDRTADPEAFLEETRTAFMRSRSRGCGFVTFKTLEDHVYHICGIGVTKKLQGRGYGKMLLGAFLEFVRYEDPKAVIRLGVDPHNSPARYLYLSFGFEVTRKGVDGGRSFELMELRP